MEKIKPKITKNEYNLIIQSINNYRFIKERIKDLTLKGFEVKKCFIPNYNGIGQLTYMPRLNEIRIIIGRPFNHRPKEILAVIIK